MSCQCLFAPVPVSIGQYAKHPGIKCARPNKAPVCCGQIREQRRREVGRLGAMIPFYTGTVALMVASPIMASVASFSVYARVVPADQFSPGRIFSSLALFGLLKPALEGLPFVLVEVGLWTWRLGLGLSLIFISLALFGLLKPVLGGLPLCDVMCWRSCGSSVRGPPPSADSAAHKICIPAVMCG